MKELVAWMDQATTEPLLTEAKSIGSKNSSLLLKTKYSVGLAKNYKYNTKYIQD